MTDSMGHQASIQTLGGRKMDNNNSQKEVLLSKILNEIKELLNEVKEVSNEVKEVSNELKEVRSLVGQIREGQDDLEKAILNRLTIFEQ